MMEPRIGIFELHSVRNRPFRVCFPNTDNMRILRRVFSIPNLDIFMPVRSLFNEHDKGSNLLGIAT